MDDYDPRFAAHWSLDYRAWTHTSYKMGQLMYYCPQLLEFSFTWPQQILAMEYIYSKQGGWVLCNRDACGNVQPVSAACIPRRWAESNRLSARFALLGPAVLSSLHQLSIPRRWAGRLAYKSRAVAWTLCPIGLTFADGQQ
jgi:hypothetical protein